MLLRRATRDDLEALTWVLIGASPSDPVYPYRFPNRHLYPEDFTVHCRLKCAEYLDNDVVVVCERPTLSDPEKTRVIAFSVWDRQPGRPAAPTPLPTAKTAAMPLPRKQPGAHDMPIPTTTTTTPPRRDADPARVRAFRDACARSKAAFFDEPYVRGHMFLKILLCHPDYRRRGAGRALTAWGVRRARRRGLCTTLFSSPMGYSLYRRLGFREVGRFPVQVPGDTARLEIPALVLAPPEHEAAAAG